MGIDGQKKSTSARGEVVDFDLLLIKQQLAAAPQNIEVARRQEFIDNKEQGKSTRKRQTVSVEENQPLPAVKNTSATDFENENGEVPTGAKTEITPVPVIDRKNKK